VVVGGCVVHVSVFCLLTADAVAAIGFYRTISRAAKQFDDNNNTIIMVVILLKLNSFSY